MLFNLGKDLTFQVQLFWGCFEHGIGIFHGALNAVENFDLFQDFGDAFFGFAHQPQAVGHALRQGRASGRHRISDRNVLPRTGQGQGNAMPHQSRADNSDLQVLVHTLPRRIAAIGV